MRIREAMTRQKAVVKPETSAREAARMMKDFAVDLLPVGTQKGLIGVLEARDITFRVTAMGLDPGETPVGRVMNLGLAACYESEKVAQAVEIMRRRKTNTVLVLNNDRKPVGVVSAAQLPCSATFQEGSPVQKSKPALGTKRARRPKSK